MNSSPKEQPPFQHRQMNIGIVYATKTPALYRQPKLKSSFGTRCPDRRCGDMKSTPNGSDTLMLFGQERLFPR